MPNEFVVDLKGKPIKYDSTVRSYLDYFSIEDVYQGYLGNCFLVAAIMGILKNTELLGFVIPIDNTERKNMKIGAYHFRLWKPRGWYDVVVDDYLPVDQDYNLLFSKNLSYRNEFWIALIEKAVAK